MAPRGQAVTRVTRATMQEQVADFVHILPDVDIATTKTINDVIRSYQAKGPERVILQQMMIGEGRVYLHFRRFWSTPRMEPDWDVFAPEPSS